MTALASLIRLHRWTLDEKRRAVADLERLAGKLKGNLDRLDQEIEAEKRHADSGGEGAQIFGAYLTASLQRRHRLVESLRQVHREIDQARSEVNEAFQDLKRYEQSAANQQRRILAQRQRREQLQSDDLAIELHRRGSADT